jgi:hypothetical protein
LITVKPSGDVSPSDNLPPCLASEITAWWNMRHWLTDAQASELWARLEPPALATYRPTDKTQKSSEVKSQ